jgi:shikimate kinase
VRPLLAGGDRAEKFRALMSERVPLYRRAATVRVNTNRRNPGAVVRYIVSRLEDPGAQDVAPKAKPRRRRRPAWRRTPVSLTPGPSEPTTPASPAELARRAEARHD